MTGLALLAFAGNSLLCRLALRDTAIDAATFTTIRLVSGALALWLMVLGSRSARPRCGNWISALALFAYAAGFSFAYARLDAGTGALLLFAAVQSTMIGYGMWKGERFSRLQLAGLILALCGLASLLTPSLVTPPLRESLLMLVAGLAWGIYSLRGAKENDPIAATAGNFLRAEPMALVLSLTMIGVASIDGAGAGYAVASGVLTSGLGYVIWYAALPGLKAIQAAAVQLSVPVIAAAGGLAFLGEIVSLRTGLASIAVLAGIALAVAHKAK